MLFKFFDFFDFSILNPGASYPSTTAHSFDILIPIVARHGPSEPPMLVFTSHSLVVATTSQSLPFGPTEKEILGNPWHPTATALELVNMAIYDGMRAMDVLIGRIGMQDGCRIRIAVALATQRGRCHVEGGIVSWIQVCSYQP